MTIPNPRSKDEIRNEILQLGFKQSASPNKKDMLTRLVELKMKQAQDIKRGIVSIRPNLPRLLGLDWFWDLYLHLIQAHAFTHSFSAYLHVSSLIDCPPAQPGLNHKHRLLLLCVFVGLLLIFDHFYQKFI